MNSETRNKLRKAMYQVWSYKTQLDHVTSLINKPWYEGVASFAQLFIKINSTRWQVFCIDKPEIDEHRAKAWHRLERYKIRNGGARVLHVAGLSDKEVFSADKIRSMLNNVTL